MEDKITLYDILEVLEMDTEDITSYYHKPSESMVVIMKEDLELVKENPEVKVEEEWKQESIDMTKDFLNNPSDYLSFPSDQDYNEESLIKVFIDSIKTNAVAFDKLNKAIEVEHTIRKFKDELFNLNLIDEWYDFREEKFLKVAQKWANDNGIEI